MKSISIENLVRKNVLTMKPYSSARDEFQNSSKGMIFLDANENPFENGVNRYPDPKQQELRTLISSLKSIAEENIIFGNGSDELLDLLYRSFCEPNLDSVITLPPTYGMYGVLANLNAIENREIVLNSEFQPNVGAILNAVDSSTKILFLCSPNNPTGNSFSKESILEILNNFGGLVVIDEAYIDFSSEESWLQKIEEYPNLIILQTFSKAYGMAGIRLGILYANMEIIKILDKVKPPYNINILTQGKAIEQLSNRKKTMGEIGQILQNKELLQRELDKLPFVEKIFQSDANFLLIKVDDAEKRYNQLLERGIVIRNRSNQELCDNCLRITIGTSTENEKLIQILNEL